MPNKVRVIISADDSFGYFVKSIEGSVTTVHSFCFTYWGARRKAERIAAQYRADIKRDSLGRPIVHEIAV